MSRIRALIVDDEALAREAIRTRIEREPDVEVVGECSSGRDAAAAIRRLAPDLVFLDIQMPGRDGFSVVESIGVEAMPLVVFVTAYDEHALRAFEVHAFDYLLKPIDTRRFRATLERARVAIRSADLASMRAQLRDVMDELRGAKRRCERLAIRKDGRVVLVDVRDVDWFEADDNYVKVHCKGAVHMLHASLSSVEKTLDPSLFLRVQRSAIVNVSRIKELTPAFHGDYCLLMHDGTRLTSGRHYRQRLLSLLKNPF